MFVGPVFSREAVVAPRRIRHYMMRTVYAVALLLLICTAWMILNGTQVVQNLGDMARFGSVLFQIMAPLQLALMLFLSAIQVASSIAIEKDRQTLILLLMSRLTNSELVLGKLLSSLLNIGVMLIAALPIFMFVVLFGGTSFEQVLWTFLVTLFAALAAGSLGAMIALWREKTFQTLALVAMILVFWLGLFEAIAVLEFDIAGLSAVSIANAASPFRAVMAAARPTIVETWPTSVLPFLVTAGSITVLLCLVSIWRVRKWNPNREVRVGQSNDESEPAQVDMLTGEVKLDRTGAAAVDAGAGHVDDRSRRASRKSRKVWDNPVLWREARTWAYGRKILFIRAAYWALAVMVFLAVYSLISSGAASRVSAEATVGLPLIAQPVAPFMLVSIVMINALAVTAITTERDGRALDLLMVTDISPREFLFGKLLGVIYVAIDMVLLPVLICIYIWYHGAMSGENLVFVFFGTAVMVVFVAMLGIHSGMSYAGSRQAIAVSLGTVFFLFLGVVTVIMMMVSFSGNVEAQLTPFLACIIGGGIGLYLALGYNVPSPALVVACGMLPLTMFYSITSLLIGNYLSVLIVMSTAFGFATMAMMVPRLSEFLVSTGRSKRDEAG